MEALLNLNSLEVRYGFNRAVDQVSFQVTAGESVGLLGSNGAGKSTTIKAILGMVRPAGGQISIFGFKPGDPLSFKEIGFAPEEGAPPEHLTGKEYLGFIAEMKGQKKNLVEKEIDELLGWFELEPNKTIRDYSKGMRRRLVLAQAFLGDPKLIILDEPLNGLDPIFIVKLRELLNQKRARGIALLYSSHILSEVEKCCTRILILKKGKCVLDLGLADVIKEFGNIETAFTQKVGSL